MNEEQRVLMRWPVNWPVKIQVKYGNIKRNYSDCYIKNINFKGLQIALKKKLPEHDALGLAIALSDGVELEMKVKVISQKVLEDGLNLYSLRITRITDHDKELIFKLIHKEFLPDLLKRWWKDIRET